MARRAVTGYVVVLVALSAAFAVQRDYVSGTILQVRQQERERVQLYIVNTPIMTVEPYFTIAVEVNGTRYEGEFLPHTSHEMLPSFWKADESVQLRVERHFLFLKREDGSEVKFLILNKAPLRAARNRP
jgi:hypothetical protein